MNAESPAGANTVAVQKDHDLPDHSLLYPGCGNLVVANWANAINLQQPLWLGFNYVQDLMPETLHEPLGKDRAYALD